jgi:hypothetical protein
MTDIAAFLTARYDEDQAQVAHMQREMVRARTAPIFAPNRDAMLGSLTGIDIFVNSDRAAADIEAKRKILALHASGPEYGYLDYSGEVMYTPACVQCGTAGEFDVPWPCETLRLLAEPYSGTPGYDEAWRVE